MERVNPGTINGNNTAIGYYAYRGSWVGGTGTNNVVIGSRAAIDYSTASYNVAVGQGADSQVDGSNNRTSIGFAAGAKCDGNNNTFIGSEAGRCDSGNRIVTGNTVVGANSGSFDMGSENALVGARIGHWSPHTGSRNSALGYEALHKIEGSGTDNVAIGYQAGREFSNGTFNILIGSGADAPSATGSNQLNIGNYIYGNTSTRQLNLGSSTLVSGIAFDTNATTSSRLATGTTAEQPACGVSQEGAQRWNSQTQNMEVCTGGTWVQLSPGWVPANGTPPVPNPNSGYFVMTAAVFNGNIGGMAGANAACLTDLLANDWQGKADAVSRGLLNANKVRAFICPGNYGSACNEGGPLTAYYFARSGDTAGGGGLFVTNTTGQGPDNSFPWSAYNYFNSTQEYWTSRFGDYGWAPPPIWGTGPAKDGEGWADACANWTDGTAGRATFFGNPSATNGNRWGQSARSCDQTLALVCFVHP